MKRPVLFILAGLKKDDSLSSLLLNADVEPGLLEGLLTPSRYLPLLRWPR